MPPDASPGPPSDEPALLGLAELRARFRETFPAVALCMFLAAIDGTIVATALPSMAAELGEVERIASVVVAYLIGLTVAAPVFGRLGDAFGRKRILGAALAGFVATSMLCALAVGITSLTLARLLQGLFGGGLITLSQALIGEAVPPRQRGNFQGWIAGVFVAASSFGPVAGGWLTGSYGWRAVFLVNLPLGLAAALLVRRLPRRPTPAGRFHLDWPGVLLFTSFVAPALLALGEAQRLTMAALLPTLALSAVALVSLLLLLRVERRAADPLLPLPLLATPIIWRANLMSALVAGATVGLVSFVPIYLETVRGVSAGGIGLALVPLTVAGGFGAMWTGRQMVRTGRTMIFPTYGLTAAALVLVVMAVALDHIPTLWLPVLLGLFSLGTGASYPVTQTVVQMGGGQHQLGAAAASVQYTRSLGSAAGAALLGAVLFGTLALGDPAVAALFVHLVQAGPTAAAAGTPPALHAELSTGFRAAFLTAALLTACGALIAWRAPVRRL